VSAKSRFGGSKRRPVHYITKLNRLFNAGLLQRGKAYHIQVRHDSWCARLSGGECRCDSDIHWVDAEKVTS
jgi:hypothetical protein